MPGWKPDCFKSASKHKRNVVWQEEIQTKKTSRVPEIKRGVTYVELEKKEGSSLGLSVSGGIDKDEVSWVSSLRPASIADRSDAIEVGDILIAVNGIRTANLSHGEIINLLRNAGDRVILELEFELPNYAPETCSSLQCKMTKIVLDKDDGTLGIVMRGGIHEDPDKTRPHTVCSVRPASSAAREGRLREGDRIVAVNEINIVNLTQFEAYDVMALALGSSVSLLVEYDIAVMEAVENASGPLLVEIDINKGSNLGLGIGLVIKTQHGNQQICIDKITQASVADRSGALHIGDQILSIDETRLDHVTLSEADSLLKANKSDQIKLEIYPANQLKQTTNVQMVRTNAVPSFSNYISMPRYNSGVSTTGTLKSLNESRFGTLPIRSSGRQYECGRWREKKHSNISLASSALSVNPGNQICRTEVMQVNLSANHQGFGLTFEGGVFPTDVLTEPPNIGFIEAGSPAHRSGLLEEGDRILSINSLWLDERTLDQCHHILNTAGKKCYLQVEFDVLETVVPSVGIFNVKLFNRGVGLGLTLSAPTNRKKSDCLLITHVKKGSVAHRCGSISPSDYLLAIDNIRLEHCTVEEAAQILVNSDKIVKLRIKKEESTEPDDNLITYTVELEKKQEPLGITISGTEDSYDPVLISELSEGGLAHRTGALHIGDHLLAINGQSLQGRTLSHAIEMLQSATETVTLKVMRKLLPKTKNKMSSRDDGTGTDKSSTPVTSVDSALGSWDDSGGDVVYAHTRHIELPDNHNQLCSRSKPHLHVSQPRGYALSRIQQQSEQYTRKYVSDIVTNVENWDAGSQYSFTSSTDTERNEWSQTLEDLQTCGQSEILRHIEDSGSQCQESDALQNTDKMCNRLESQKSTGIQHVESSSPKMYHYSDVVGEKASCANRGITNYILARKKRSVYKQSKSSNATNSATSSTALDKDGNDHYSNETDISSSSKSHAGSSLVEVHKYVLNKPSREDFGFGLSDGLYENAVYISAIRQGSAGQQVGLQTFDRILQVNELKIKAYKCCEVVPLIAQCGNTVNLIISRNPLAKRQVATAPPTSTSWQGLPDNADIDPLSRSFKSSKTV